MSGIANHKVMCYINGVRIDPITVSVTATRSEFASFAITVPGIPEWDILPPRSHVVVFYADPIAQTWRMLVEGEYIAYQKLKTASGQRQVSLTCRSLHGVFQSATNVSLGSVTYRQEIPSGIQLSAVAKQSSVVANGRRIEPSGQTTLDVPSLPELMQIVSSSSTTASEFFPAMVRYVLSQLPVEAFYMHERFLIEKMFAFKDDAIAKMVDQRRMGMISNFYAQTRAEENQRLSDLLKTYEDMVMYQHIPLLAPPIYSPQEQIDSTASSTRRGDLPDNSTVFIPELLFTPYLYNVIPPSCNVIFSDQIVTLSRTRDFAAEPTRVITKLNAAAGQDIVKIYMSNDVTDSFDAGTELITNTVGGNPAFGASHMFLSGEEHMRGVVAETVPIALNSVNGETKSPSSTWERYFDQATRHYYAVASGSYRSADLSCVFLPTLVVGVPCLVEDLTGPFHGYVESVTHILSNDVPPQTQVRVSQVRPALWRNGIDVTPPLPIWLNTAYLPSGINGSVQQETTQSGRVHGTWAKLLGKNAVDALEAQSYSAMVPDGSIKVGTVASATVPALNPAVNEGGEYSVQQVNMDELASQVIPIPRYEKDYTFLGTSENTIADRLRAMADPNRAMAAYQWRPGVTLSQYAKFHGLKIIGQGSQIDAVNTGSPPEHLFDPSEVDRNPTRAFASPLRMLFVGNRPIDEQTKQLKLSTTEYGSYRLERVDGRLYSPVRQKTMLTIKAALDRRITKS